jgi:hypothetical protein
LFRIQIIILGWMDGWNGSRHQRWSRKKIIMATWNVRLMEDVHDYLCKMKVKGLGGKTKNREEWRQIVQKAKAHPEL